MDHVIDSGNDYLGSISTGNQLACSLKPISNLSRVPNSRSKGTGRIESAPLASRTVDGIPDSLYYKPDRVEQNAKHRANIIEVSTETRYCRRFLARPHKPSTAFGATGA